MPSLTDASSSAGQPVFGKAIVGKAIVGKAVVGQAETGQSATGQVVMTKPGISPLVTSRLDATSGSTCLVEDGWAWLEQIISDRAIDSAVVIRPSSVDVSRQLSRLLSSVIQIDESSEARDAARVRLANSGSEHVHLFCGRAHRVVADLIPRLSVNTLFVLNACGGGLGSVGNEIFQIPRGRGAIVITHDHGAKCYNAVQDQLLRWSPNHRVERFVGEDGSEQLVAFPQRRVHVTFLIEKYTHEYENSGLSINLDNLVATLHQTGFATYDIVHYDERYHTGRGIAAEELQKPVSVDEHLLVCTCHYHSASNPSVDLLEAAKRSGTKIAFMWLDKKTSTKTPAYSGIADVNVVFDGNDFDLPNPWPVFTPKNPLYYNDPGLERDIDFSVIGESRHLQQRKDMARLLGQETRINPTVFTTSAADTKRSLTLEEYSSIFKRSKMSLVLTKDRVRQLKGRIFEVLHCGALLLCDINPYINTYLEPGVDYVPFRDYEDMVQKAAYYLDHEDERLAIARSGHSKVVKYYNHHVFWRSLLARAGMSAGEV